ncbi:hypothetical protein ACF0H5_019205 [Mactra antiquata]
MAGNAILVLPIPAYLQIRDQQWTSSLCIGYSWCVLTFRLAQLLSLMVISIHWSTLLKMSAQKKKYFSTKFLKVTIVFIWICSAIFGLLPLIGVASDDFYENNKCKFLAFGIGTGYGLFFLIIIMISTFVSILCASDAMVLIKHMKAVAKTKYQAGRFHIPDRRADLPIQGNSSLAERYHRLQFAWDLSRFVLIFVVLSFAGNQVLYGVIQCVQLFTKFERETLEIISLYLVGIEALLLPHTLWMVSRRYRHALIYQWNVYALRNKEHEEDEPYSCTLQSYSQRERDRLSVVPSRPSSTIGRAGGLSASGTLRSIKSEATPRDFRQANGQTRAHVHTLFHEERKARTPEPEPRANGVIKGEVHVERPPSLYDERPIDIQEIDFQRRAHTYSAASSIVRNPSNASSSTSQHSHRLPLQNPRLDLTRTSSGRSRRDWKEQMRKKHLPPIFVNEGYEASDKTPVIDVQEIPTIAKRIAPNAGGTSLNYYMSSDFHPDYLTESLPRLKHHPSTESEQGEPYTNCDIDEVLDTDSITDRQLVNAKARAAHTYHEENIQSNSIPLSNKVINDFSDKNATKGVYNTFDDLSKLYLRDESEIELAISDIPVEEIDGMIYPRAHDAAIINKGTSLNYDNRGRPLSSFKPDDTEMTSQSTFKTSSRPEPSPRNSVSFRGNNDIQTVVTSFGANPYRTASPYLDNGVSNNTFEPFATRMNINKHIPKRSYEMAPMPNVICVNEGKFHLENNPNPKRYGNLGENSINLEHSTGFQVSGMYPDVIIHDVAGNVGKQNTSIDDENASSGSNSSVTISPYKGEPRHRPWLDDIELQNDDNSEFNEPLVQDSDTDTLRDSQNSADLRLAINFDARFQGSSHSELTTPVSSIFDEETDRGFEEALDVHIGPGNNVYGGVGLCFESIQEEPEDLTSSGSNPFLDNFSNDDEFRTQAVISRSSNNSLTSSSASVSDNPLSSSPIRSQNKQKSEIIEVKQSQSPIVRRSDEAEIEFGDSGFTSGLEKGNLSDSSSHQEITPRGQTSSGRNSPWPEKEVETNMKMQFESNFCSDKSIGQSIASPKVGYKSTKIGRSESAKSDDSKKPINKALAAVKSSTRPHPVRVKSFERSPVQPKKSLRRGHSFEGVKMDVEPAYF